MNHAMHIAFRLLHKRYITKRNLRVFILYALCRRNVDSQVCNRE
jgi:hypothetical protein